MWTAVVASATFRVSDPAGKRSDHNSGAKKKTGVHGPELKAIEAFIKSVVLGKQGGRCARTEGELMGREQRELMIVAAFESASYAIFTRVARRHDYVVESRG